MRSLMDPVLWDSSPGLAGKDSERIPELLKENRILCCIFYRRHYFGFVCVYSSTSAHSHAASRRKVPSHQLCQSLQPSPCAADSVRRRRDSSWDEAFSFILPTSSPLPPPWFYFSVSLHTSYLFVCLCLVFQPWLGVTLAPLPSGQNMAWWAKSHFSCIPLISWEQRTCVWLYFCLTVMGDADCVSAFTRLCKHHFIGLFSVLL